MKKKGTAVVNKLIGLTPEADRRLREIKHRSGVPQSQIIREGIEMAIQKYAAQTRWESHAKKN